MDLFPEDEDADNERKQLSEDIERLRLALQGHEDESDDGEDGRKLEVNEATSPSRPSTSGK